MANATSTPATLSYQPPSAQRRRARRLALVSLVLSSLLLAIVGRLLYAKFAPLVRRHIIELAAQRAVLVLPAPGSTLDLPGPTATTRSSAAEVAAAQWRAAFALPPPSSSQSTSPTSLAGMVAGVTPFMPSRFLRAEPDQLAYIGPLTNAVGEERIVCVRIATLPIGDRVEPPGFSLDVRDRVGTFRPERAVKSPHTEGWLLPRDRPLHMDAPAQDPSNPRRLLFRGVANGRPFLFEILLDASDHAACFDMSNEFRSR